MQTPRDYTLPPLEGSDPAVGHMLAAFQDARERTLRAIENMPPGALDARPIAGHNTIGTLLYHVAGVEASWVYEDVLGLTDFPPEVNTLFPYDMRDEQGLLYALAGNPLDYYLDLLAAVRERAIEVYRAMTAEDFRRPRFVPNDRGGYNVTPEWALYHLMQHEAEHRGQIQSMLDAINAR
ncbi:MAG TPA: DinB family protein [Chloroflexia bacterium]|nr:DinB family protein [Chloroflexia bacterium]